MIKEKTLTIIIAILLIISLISGGLLLVYLHSLKKAANEFDDLAQLFEKNMVREKTAKVEKPNKNNKNHDKEPEDVQEPQPEINIDFGELSERNPDIAAWILIPGTKLNYPVMHTPKDPEYYLYRNFNKEYSSSGVPFIDAKSTLEGQPEGQSDNLLIHGHNMKNGSMFAQLLLYKDEEFFKEHPTIEFYTPTGKKNYDIISVFPTKIYSKKSLEFKYQSFINAKGQGEFDTYVEAINIFSMYDTGIMAKYGDKLMTLSTCAYHTDNGRFVVVAKER